MNFLIGMLFIAAIVFITWVLWREDKRIVDDDIEENESLAPKNGYLKEEQIERKKEEKELKDFDKKIDSQKPKMTKAQKENLKVTAEENDDHDK